MFSIPSLPPWDGMHPLVVHFPIALTMVTPLLVLMALVSKRYTRVWLAASALMMLLAAGGAWVAASTGSAAEELAERVPGAKAILEEHEELGESAEYFAFALAGVLVIGTGLFWRWGEKCPRRVIIGVGLAYLVANGAGALVVANAAHEGGRLVHEVGVRARLSTASAAPGPAITPKSRSGDD
jgi:uncharacterized membrane protein